MDLHTAKQELPPRCRPVEEKTLSCAGKTILLVDDDQTIADACRELLLKEGYTILTAGNAKEALKIYAANNDGVDLVILDMILPDRHGVETYERLKEINPEVKVLLTSGADIPENAVNPLQSARAGFLRKPFSTATLKDSITVILNHPAPTP